MRPFRLPGQERYTTGMENRPGYTEAHLVVAAVRVLAHQHGGRPPRVEDISALTGLSDEWAGVLVNGLEREGILRCLRGPFETRVEIADHLALEALPKGSAADTVDQEMRAFSKKKRAEEAKLKQLFSSGDALKQQEAKIDRIADQFKNWKDKDDDGPAFPPRKRD